MSNRRTSNTNIANIRLFAMAEDLRELIIWAEEDAEDTMQAGGSAADDKRRVWALQQALVLVEACVR